MKIESKHKRLVQNEKGPKVFLANVCSNYKKQHDFSYRNIFFARFMFLSAWFSITFTPAFPLSRVGSFWTLGRTTTAEISLFGGMRLYAQGFTNFTVANFVAKSHTVNSSQRFRLCCLYLR